MDPPGRSFRSLPGEEDDDLARRRSNSSIPEKSIPAELSTAELSAAFLARSIRNNNNNMRQEEENASPDEDRAVCDTTTGVVEARAELVLDDENDDANNNTTTISTPGRKQLAYASFPAHLLGERSPLPPSMQSAYTTATATTGGESFRTGPSLPDSHLLNFKHQVQEFKPPSIILSSRHIQPAQPEVAPMHEGNSHRLSQFYDPNSSSFSQCGFTQCEAAPPAQRRAIEMELRLVENGFPNGLARHLIHEGKSMYPVRFWCIDNSSSMYKDDCHRFVHDEDHLTSCREPTVKCTRWTELQETAKYHARLAGILGATTIFRLLNHYSSAPQEYAVSEESDTESVLAILDEIQPDGVSLLTQHVSSICERIQSIEHDLRQQGQKAVVVLATDGLPSDQFGESTPAMQQDFINSLKHLQLLPVWIVVRLCTTDRDVLNFYRRLDKELERPVDVIGSFLTEAKEVARLNKWLNYAMPLHRARETGLSSRLPDLLDERQLTKDEFREMVELLFDKDSLETAPNIHSDWYEFVSYLREHVLPRTGQQWNPVSKRVECWIDCGKLKTAYGAGLRHKKDQIVLGMQRAFSKDVI